MLEEVSCLNAHLLRDLKLFTAAIFKDGYFNDGSAEDCYFLEALLPLNTLTMTIFEDCYFTVDNADDQARGDFEAGQEGHQELLGKVGGPEEDHIVVPSPEPTEVPLLPTLSLAGLA